VPGAKYIQFARDNGGRALVRIIGGSEFTFLNVTNYGVSDCHYMCLESSGLKVLGCRSLIPGGQWFGGNADGVHTRGNELGPWVEGCLFEGVGDDAVALYSKGIFILNKDSDTVLRLGTEFFNLQPGHRLSVFNPRDAQMVAESIEVDTVTYKAAGSDGYAQAHYLVTLSNPIAAGITTTNTNPLYNDQVFNCDRGNLDFVIRGNTFRCVRRYGTVVRAISGVIEGNIYDRISDVPIFFRNEPDYWRNGLQGEDVRVLNNTIVDSGFSIGSYDRGQIQTTAYKLGYAIGNGRIQRDILIAGNSISNWQEKGILISNADGVIVRGNTLTSTLAGFDNTRDHYAIYVDNSNNILIQENDISDPRQMEADIEVTSNTSYVQFEEGD
jgi:hypothetical protein